jgi:fructose-bisphosphate aldolase, class II
VRERVVALPMPMIVAGDAATGICPDRFEALGCTGHGSRIKPVALEKTVGRYV